MAQEATFQLRQVKPQPHYGVTSADVAQATRGTAGYFSAKASEATAADLNIISDVTGRGDGLAMNIAGGAAAVQAQVLDYAITSADVAQATRGTTGYFGGRASAGKTIPAAIAAAALLSRGVSNPNMACNVRNPDALRLGEEIGSVVTGQEQGRNTLRFQPRKQ